MIHKLVVRWLGYCLGFAVGVTSAAAALGASTSGASPAPQAQVLPGSRVAGPPPLALYSASLPTPTVPPTDPGPTMTVSTTPATPTATPTAGPPDYGVFLPHILNTFEYVK